MSGCVSQKCQSTHIRILVDIVMKTDLNSSRVLPNIKGPEIHQCRAKEEQDLFRWTTLYVFHDDNNIESCETEVAKFILFFYLLILAEFSWRKTLQLSYSGYTGAVLGEGEPRLMLELSGSSGLQIPKHSQVG